jgi:hypothetical protein
MSGFVGVVAHPYFAVSDDKGEVVLANVPAGEYEVAAWHEKYGEQVQKIKIGDGEAKTLDFKFSKAAE